MKRPPRPKLQDSVPLPRLSDPSAVELYLFVEHLLLLIESRYGAQIRRHFDARHRHNLIEPEPNPNRPSDDPPF